MSLFRHHWANLYGEQKFSPRSHYALVIMPSSPFVDLDTSRRCTFPPMMRVDASQPQRLISGFDDSLLRKLGYLSHHHWMRTEERQSTGSNQLPTEQE
jgi:hypothetical protein